MTLDERIDDMLGRYGEVCTKAQASKIMGCSYYKIRAMLEDGRLKTEHGRIHMCAFHRRGNSPQGTAA